MRQIRATHSQELSLHVGPMNAFNLGGLTRQRRSGGASERNPRKLKPDEGVYILTLTVCRIYRWHWQSTAQLEGTVVTCLVEIEVTQRDSNDGETMGT